MHEVAIFVKGWSERRSAGMSSAQVRRFFPLQHSFTHDCFSSTPAPLSLSLSFSTYLNPSPSFTCTKRRYSQLKYAPISTTGIVDSKVFVKTETTATATT